MTDIELESEIKLCVKAMHTAFEADDRKTCYEQSARLSKLIMLRTPEQLQKMELERGLV